jgi:signal transduction histidine kinase
MSNARFNELANADGEWRIDGVGQPHRSLRKLVVEQAEMALREGGDRIVKLEGTGRGQLLSLRIEGNRRRKQHIALAMLEDVTEQALREEELSHTRTSLLQRERLRVLGLLAAAVAHDLGSTLRGASFQLASLRPFGFRDRAAALQGAMERLEIASEIVNRLHDFARGGSMPALGPVRLARVIQKAIAVTDLEKSAAGKPLRVVTSLPELPPVQGNETELSLLFVNLLRNAREAMPGGGTIQITARRKGTTVRVRIADDGPGIPPNDLPRVFSPFFSTKGAAGTGLGLWLAKGTMRRSGGSISVANGPKRGAVFSLVFPVAVSLSAPGRRRAPGARDSPAARKLRRAPRTARRS